VVDRKFQESRDEKNYRTAKSQPDPEWHSDQVSHLGIEWYAVTFHQTHVLLARPDNEVVWDQLQQAAQEAVNADLPLPPVTVKVFTIRKQPLPKKTPVPTT